MRVLLEIHRRMRRYSFFKLHGMREKEWGTEKICGTEEEEARLYEESVKYCCAP